MTMDRRDFLRSALALPYISGLQPVSTLAVDFASYATGDGRLVNDGAMTATSAVLTSATANFTNADVGKAITVGGAGVATRELRTTILSYQSATQVTLAVAASTTVSSAGVMWGTDASAGLQSALDALAAAGGGVLRIPGKKFVLNTAAIKNFVNLASHLIIQGEGSASQLLIKGSTTTAAITLQNLEHLTIEGVTFVGCPKGVNDCLKVLSISSVQMATLRDCNFYGLSAIDVGGGAILEANTTDLVIERCAFRGCATNSGQVSSVVENRAWIGFRIEDSIFLDWGWLDGIEHSKTGIASAYAWVRFWAPANGGSQADANGQNLVTFRNVRMDEGALFGFMVNPSAGTVSRVLVDGFECNVSVAGAGMFIKKVTQVTISNAWIGYVASGTHDAIVLDTVTSARLDKVITANNARRITLTGVTALELIDCDYGTLVPGTAVVLERKNGGFKRALYPATPAMALQTACSLYAGTGAPNNAHGANGDIYFRSDGGAGTTIYQKRAGVWVATGA